MAEGDPYGPIAESKTDYLRKKILALKNFSLKTDQLKNELIKKGYAENLVNQIARVAGDIIKQSEREILLFGAPFKLKAEGVSLTLYGSENTETVEKSAALVRNYIFLEDRIKQLDNPGNVAIGSPLPESFNLQSVLSLLIPNSPIKLLESGLQNLNRLASEKGDGDVVSIADGMRYDLSVLAQPEAAANIASAPARTDNPFGNINDKQELQEKMSEVEKQINSTVVEVRNREAADFFVAALKNIDDQVGILQFGAGHTAGLVSELTARGLTVVVITPQAVKTS